MKRWGIGLVLVLLSCLPILLSVSSSRDLLNDSDTKVLLEAVRERSSPLSWFGGDWPLGNHFYRPISTLAFEMDNALYGTNARGYALTNALLCVACVLLLFWVWREVTDHLVLATLATVLFAAWHTGWLTPALEAVRLAALAALALALLPGRRFLPTVLALLVLWYLAYELAGASPLYYRMLGWLPGRTASVMTVFALAAMAAYARYERLGAERLPPPEPTPLDPPATKGTVLRETPPRHVWIWAVLAGVFLILALGSYEQAVMLPAALFGVAVSLRLQRYKVRWGWQGLFWGILVAYLAFRSQVVPTEASGYQMQQFRSGLGVWQSIADYVLPSLVQLYTFAHTLDVGWLQFLGLGPWLVLLFAVSNVGAYAHLWKVQRVPMLTGLLLSVVTFLPMAWLKPFDHYAYWPMAMRSLFTAALVLAAGRALVTAASRPALQAPARPDPAPGSLPRP